MSAPASAALHAPAPRREEYDVCVIGAGAAGTVLTELLARASTRRVCLLEAGPEHFRDRREPYRVRSLMREHIGVNEGRVTAFGGATNTWGGGLIRAVPADFEPLAGRPDTAWPVPYASLLPHYRAIEALFGLPSAELEPVFLEHANVRVRRRPIPVLPFRSKNFARRFGPGLRVRAHVTIRCGAAITGFTPGPEGVGCLQVRFPQTPPDAPPNSASDVPPDAAVEIRARRFVICAGIVNSNLLARRLLDACAPGVPPAHTGRFFHDHVSFPIARLHPETSGVFSRRFGYRFEHGLMFGEHFDLECTDRRRPGAFMHLSFDTSESAILRPVREVLNAIQRRKLSFERGISARELGALLTGLPRLGFMRFFHRRLYLDRGTKILATLDLEQLPLESHRLEAEGDGGAVAWDISPHDLTLATDLLPVCRDILERLRAEAPFKIETLIPDPARDPEAFAAYVRRTSEDTYHCAGGLRMSADSDMPVDPDLRLRAVPNVHLLTTATFPRIGTSNPTHTLLALTHRLATQLLDAAPSA